MCVGRAEPISCLAHVNIDFAHSPFNHFSFHFAGMVPEQTRQMSEARKSNAQRYANIAHLLFGSVFERIEKCSISIQFTAIDE